MARQLFQKNVQLSIAIDIAERRRRKQTKIKWLGKLQSEMATAAERARRGQKVLRKTHQRMSKEAR